MSIESTDESIGRIGRIKWALQKSIQSLKGERQTKKAHSFFHNQPISHTKQRGENNGNIIDLCTWVGGEKWDRNKNGREGILLHQKFKAL
jgi:hypothetical protein